MIETLDPDEAETWIFHIGHRVERDGQGSCKEKHVYPAVPCARGHSKPGERSEEHTSELQSRVDLVCRLLLEKKKRVNYTNTFNIVELKNNSNTLDRTHHSEKINGNKDAEHLITDTN